MFGRRPVATSRCEPTTSDALVARGQLHRDPAVPAARRRMHVGVGQDPDAFVLEDRPDRRARRPRPRGRSARSSRWMIVTSLPKRRYICAEFETDVAAAEDHQVLRQEVDLHHRGIGEIRHGRRCPGIGGTSARPPTLMKICSGLERVGADRNLLGRDEAGMAVVHRDVRVLAQAIPRPPRSTP